MFFRDPYIRIILLITIISILILVGGRLYFSKNNYGLKITETEVKLLPRKGFYLIKHVIDGDTVVLNTGEKVRLIGIDAPELHHPVFPAQRFGEEAANYLKNLTEGFRCTLEVEPFKLKDLYNRTLAYVYVNDKLINAEMVKMGYAYVDTNFPFKLKDEFIRLENQAKEKQSGLWNLSIKDGRITNLVKRYDSLNEMGRKRLDAVLEELVRQYPIKVRGQDD